jgi:hypothetical protein
MKSLRESIEVSEKEKQKETLENGS